MDDELLARVLAEFPHVAGDDPQGFASMLANARKGMSDELYAQFEARHREVERRLRTRAAREDGPPWEQVWGTAFSMPFEVRAYDDPMQLGGLTRWLPKWRDEVNQDGDWTLALPISTDHLEVGLRAIAETAGFFAKPVVALDPQDPAQRQRISRTLCEIEDLAHTLRLWFDAGDEE